MGGGEKRLKRKREKDGRVRLRVCGSFVESETDGRGVICVARKRVAMVDAAGYIADRRSREAEIGYTRFPSVHASSRNHRICLETAGVCVEKACIWS